MIQISVPASQVYTVTVGTNILPQLAQLLASCTNARRVCIVSDDHVWPLYGPTVEKIIQQAGYQVFHFQIPAGEASKNMSSYALLLDALVRQGLTRRDCLVALGGGVVGDLTGFAAATYLRGMDYIQVPTSLLAMVDSSVGGKTGIDLPGGKNLCGAFWQPKAVLCDCALLRTLPRKEFLSGCAEVIKYAILYDPALFALLETSEADFHRENVIARCIAWKRDAVAADERDTGARMLLNLGHTFGHAIEVCSKYTIPHGYAVAAGICMAARAAQCPDASRICRLISAFQLPTSCDFSADALYRAALADKKSQGDHLQMILPQRLGNCKITPIAISRLEAFIEAGY